MTYSGELVMPAGYVEVAEEEMMYLDGGFCMARSAAQKIIDVTIFIASCYIGGLSSVGKLITKFGKVKAITVVTNLAIKVGLTKTIASRIAQCIGIITGWSIGGGVAYLLDRYDKDGVSGKIRF